MFLIDLTDVDADEISFIKYGHFVDCIIQLYEVS